MEVMEVKERVEFEKVANIIEELAKKGVTMQDFAQFVRELSEREEFVNQDVVVETKDTLNLEQLVTRILHEFGIPASIRGYRYVRYAICLVVKDISLLESTVKVLYPKVAEEFDTTGARVERAIRHAIELAWDRGKPELLEDYFGYTVSECKGKPTNREFIALVADHIRCNCNYNS